VGILVLALNSIYTVGHPKYFNDWGNSATVANFYNEPRESIDVLIFGTSTMSNGIQPAVLWNERGFTSYNLATSRQHALSAYYLLMEALKYQSPKVVVLPARWLTVPPFFSKPDEPEIDWDSAALHMALDYMRLSDVKFKAALDIASQSSTQKAIEYILPLYTYHNRQDITKDDFDSSFVYQPHPLKGSCIQFNINSVTIEPDMGSSEKVYELSGINPDYVDRIIELCKSEGIEVVLLALPLLGVEWDWAQHDAVQQYADAMGVPFLDMNTADVMEALALDGDTDFWDEKHETIRGSAKTSRYLAAYLADNYDLGRDYPDAVAASFDSSSALFMAYSRLFDRLVDLRNATQLADYLALLTDIEDCIVVISVRDEFSYRLTEEQKAALSGLGLATDFYADIFRYSYAAVIDSGSVVFEECSPDLIKYDYKSPEGISISVISAGAGCGNKSSIVYEGKDYSLNERGLNIVLFSKIGKGVIDSVNFDSYEGAEADRGEDKQQ